LIETDWPADVGGERPFSWLQAFGRILCGPTGGFDAIVGNPPYINIRLLTKTRGDNVKRYLKSRYRCAHRAYDLYVLFIERAFQLLRPGGMCGLIVPNKIATLEYAAPCRSLLLDETTIHRIADLSECRVFPGAGVYPYVLIWQKNRAVEHHRIAVTHFASVDDVNAGDSTSHVGQSELSAQGGFHVHDGIDVESRVATRPLKDVVQLHSGTTGFAAARVAAALREQSECPDIDCFPFIVSGNIDRYAVRLGSVRFAKREFSCPILPVRSEQLSERKRELYRGSKIVIAGMTRRLEAAWDAGGLALGVQVYAARAFRDDAHYLLALLNSKLLSYLFRARFRAKQLASGYLAINKSQLGELPIRFVPSADRADRRLCLRLGALAEEMGRLSKEVADGGLSSGERSAIDKRLKSTDREIDLCVYRFYRLTDEEIARVECCGD
jgi:hypothetical protein